MTRKDNHLVRVEMKRMKMLSDAKWDKMYRVGGHNTLHLVVFMPRGDMTHLPPFLMK